MCKSGLFFWLITLILAQTASKVNSTTNNVSYNIDFATIVSGIANIGVINSYSGKQVTISIPTQEDTNYKVLVSGDGGGSAYSFVTFTVLNKTTTSFVIEGWNNYESASGNIRATYLLIP